MRGNAADIDAAVQAARAAFDTGAWGKLTATERGRLLSKLAQLVAADHEKLAQIEARDTGKPLAQRATTSPSLARYFEFYGGAADKVHGEVIPFLAGYTSTCCASRYGVTAHIMPWNYPAQMFGRTLAPALAMGNAAVLKPAEDACLSALRFAELAIEAGLPAGALNIVTGLGEEAGAALTAHPGIDFVSFTGSPRSARWCRRPPPNDHRKCVLELGGKSPQIVFADADLDRALPIIVRAIVQNAGQTCTAGSRAAGADGRSTTKFVGRVAEQFSQGARRHASDGPRLRPGDQHGAADARRGLHRRRRERRHSGARRRADRRRRAERRLLRARRRCSARCRATTRSRARKCSVRCWRRFRSTTRPTRSRSPTPPTTACVAGVWTENGGRQKRMAKACSAGQVFINCYGAGGGVELPFGGVKRSGHGREKGFVALEEMSDDEDLVQYHG